MTVFRIVWESAFHRRRLFIWNIVVPLILLVPVVFSAAAAPHRVAVFGIFVVFFGTFGSAIPMVRDARDSWVDQLLRTGFPMGFWLLQRTLAEAAIDLIQLVPVMAVFAIAGDSWASTPWLLLATGMTLWFTNLLGPLIAAFVRSLAEAALASAAMSLLLLHYAGFFRRPVPGLTQTAATLDPYTAFNSALEAVTTGTTIDPGSWMGSTLTIVTATILAVVTIRFWGARLCWPHGTEHG